MKKSIFLLYIYDEDMEGPPTVIIGDEDDLIRQMGLQVVDGHVCFLEEYVSVTVGVWALRLMALVTILIVGGVLWYTKTALEACL